MALAQAAFSFGRDRELLRLIEDGLGAVTLHDIRSDIDANRTWVSLSGEPASIIGELERVCELVLERIDLPRHIAEHPRTGALDICNFVDTPAEVVEGFGRWLSATYELPVFLAHRNAAWREIRDLGFGGILELDLRPDSGPATAHPRLGIAALDMRPFSITVAAGFEEEFGHFVKSRARDIEERNRDGDPLFAEVSSVAYPSPSYGQSTMIIEFGNPDAAPPDPVLEWLDRKAKVAGITVKGFDVIGAVRRVDLLETRNVPIRPDQVVDT